MRSISENIYGYKKRLDFMEEVIDDHCQKNGISKNDIHILDVGCGTGLWITLPLACEGYQITGSDIDERSIDFASSQSFSPNAKFVLGDLSNLSENFDVVICSEVLEHVKDSEDFLRKLSSRLKVGGVLLLTTPNGRGWFEFESFLFNRIGMRGLFERFLKTRFAPKQPENEFANSSLDNSRHINFFTIQEIKRMAGVAGLKIEKIRNSTVFSGPMTSIFFWNNRKFMNLNNGLADIIPRWAASGWYFVMKK